MGRKGEASSFVKKIKSDGDYDKLKCWNESSGERIYIKKKLASDENTIVLSGVLKSTDGSSSSSGDIEVIIKHCSDHRCSSDLEASYYHFLYPQIPGLPGHFSGFQLSDVSRKHSRPVLVLQKLQPLTSEDNSFIVGSHIVRQLQKMHGMRILWGSTKPDNVMKNGSMYTMIDFGSIVRVSDGNCRKSFSHRWSSQKDKGEESCVAIFAWNDLYELGRTVVGLELERRGKKVGSDELHKYRIKEYEDYLETLSRFKLSFPDEVYDRCVHILEKNSR
jgi:serine/threonine protein kinase